MKTITSLEEFRDFLKSRADFAFTALEIEDFVKGTVFTNGSLRGWAQNLLIEKLTYKQFSEVIEALGLVITIKTASGKDCRQNMQPINWAGCGASVGGFCCNDM